MCLLHWDHKKEPGISRIFCTVESALKDNPIGHKNVSQDSWSLVTGSFTLKM